jgi:hypothetical protein
MALVDSQKGVIMTYTSKLVVAVKSAGKFVKEDRSQKDPVVYLPFGAEYSLYFKNLGSRKATVAVTIDGKDVLNGYNLIVEPGKPFELERFITEMNKGNRFKFIEKTQQISEHRGEFPEDGLVVVKFQFEAPPVLQTNLWWTNQIYNSTRIGSDPFRSSSSINCCCDSTVYGSAGVRGDVGPQGDPGVAIASAACYSANVEGITAKGMVSDQAFNYGSVGPLDPEIHTVVLQLKGGTAPVPQNVHIPLIKMKSKCDTCGTIFRGFPQFCSNCGSAINAEI